MFYSHRVRIEKPIKTKKYRYRKKAQVLAHKGHSTCGDVLKYKYLTSTLEFWCRGRDFNNFKYQNEIILAEIPGITTHTHKRRSCTKGEMGVLEEVTKQTEGNNKFGGLNFTAG